jgi:deoxyribonuclease V
MKARMLHEWPTGDGRTAKARDLQERLASRVIRKGGSITPGLVAGVDISVRPDGTARAAVVVLTFPGMTPVETRTVEGNPGFPYVPGLLSFREAPLVLAACERLACTPDLIMVDGQGIAHPRRLGIASHLGLLLDVPTIGCAKSRLIGIHETPGQEAGSCADLVDGGELIGAVLRTKTGVKPVYVSIGHKIDLETAIARVLECCRGYRLPHPTRLAHLAAGGNLAAEKSGGKDHISGIPIETQRLASGAFPAGRDMTMATVR